MKTGRFPTGPAAGFGIPSNRSHFAADETMKATILKVFALAFAAHIALDVYILARTDFLSSQSARQPFENQPKISTAQVVSRKVIVPETLRTATAGGGQIVAKPIAVRPAVEKTSWPSGDPMPDGLGEVQVSAFQQGRELIIAGQLVTVLRCHRLKLSMELISNAGQRLYHTMIMENMPGNAAQPIETRRHVFDAVQDPQPSWSVQVKDLTCLAE